MSNLGYPAVKIERVIKSCRTSEQLEVARKLLNLFAKTKEERMSSGSYIPRLYLTAHGHIVASLRETYDTQQLALQIAERVLKG